MKRLFVIVMVSVLALSAKAQCPTVPNGEMENRQMDSFKSLLDTNYFYSLDQAGWHTTMEPIRHGHPDQAKAPENTSSTTSYEGNYALKVPENLYILSYGDAFYRDSCSKVPSGVGGYYLTDDSAKNLTFNMAVVFTKEPSKYVEDPRGFRKSEVNVFQLPPSNGNYKSFHFSFHDSTVKNEDSMLIYFSWFVDDPTYIHNLDFLVDSLHFSCDEPNSIFSEAKSSMNLYNLEAGDFVLRTPSASEYHYQAISLSGQVLESGSFEKEIRFNSFGQFIILQVYDGLHKETFKIPSH